MSRRSSERSRTDLAELVVVWVVTGTVVLAFATTTAIGPVLLTVYGSHGVHLADVIMLVFGLVVAGGITLRRFIGH
jgi:hypothetical protein